MENKQLNKVHDAEIDVPRNIDVVTTEIKTICMQARQLALVYAIEVGRRLQEAKGMLQHGEWGVWLKEKVQFSQSTANNFMRLYDEYGDTQIAMFGAEINSQTLGNLSYTKALKLLALPEEERENFVNDNNVEDISVRELDKLIKERDDALKKAEKTDELEKAVDVASEKIISMESDIKSLNTQIDEHKKQAETLSAQLQKAKDNEKKAKEKYKTLKENPEIAPDVLEKMKSEAESKAAEKFRKELEDKLSEANSKVDKAKKEKSEVETALRVANAKVEELKKQVQLSNPAITKFKTLFDQLQKDFVSLNKALSEIDDAEMSSKLIQAVNALCKQYIKE